ncbi:hypothetical protein SAMN05444354_11046 [Stigmatella aurantiaca]|uniref:Uncharacterized protein n=1 Tax=Stigmatella aurantiaca TaxID=41 RepID=A0A1H7UIR5_STIAU|nr:hypothetical protein [Stigmatella aurantiaca]SEL96167.1 hypothetical protein SAMN05444354_11046 [Stigmatella aurantiaca]
MPTPAEPRALFEALRTGAALPDFPAEAVTQARALAQDVAGAPASAVEALPAPLVEALLEGSVLAGSPALAEALSQSGVKPVAKAAKKALYRLRSRGIAVAEAPRPPAEPPRAAEPPEPLPALITGITGEGQRALLLGRYLRGGGIECTQAVLSDELGVLELSLVDITRGSYRRRVKETRDEGLAVELSQEEGAARLAEAAALNLRSRTPFPTDLELALRHHGVQPATAEPTVPAPEPEDVRGVLEGHTLHETPEISQWLPPEEELRKVVQKVDEIAASPLALSGPQREEQTLQAARALARAFFTPGMRRLYGLRLWRMADFFERGGRAPVAQVARAEARRLFHGPEEPFSRFAERLFEKLLQLAGPQMGALPPVGAPQPPAPSPGKRSPGGLILP